MSDADIKSRIARFVDHPRLVGASGASGLEVYRRASRLTVFAIALANFIGACVVTAFAVLALPKPVIDDEALVIVLNVCLAGAYVVFALVVGIVWGRRRIEGGKHGIRGWLSEERAPTQKERKRALRAPLRVMVVEAVLWGIAVDRLHRAQRVLRRAARARRRADGRARRRDDLGRGLPAHRAGAAPDRVARAGLRGRTAVRASPAWRPAGCSRGPSAPPCRSSG